MSHTRTHAVLIAGALLVTAALTMPATAQFEPFDWELQGSIPGWGRAFPDHLLILGPDGDCVTGSPIVWLEAVAPVSGTVRARYDFTSLDEYCGLSGQWDVPVQVINGGATDLFTFCSSFGAFDFHVDAGDTFGFGVRSVDCLFGPGVLVVTSLTLTPDEETAGGPTLDALLQRETEPRRLVAAAGAAGRHAAPRSPPHVEPRLAVRRERRVLRLGRRRVGRRRTPTGEAGLPRTAPPAPRAWWPARRFR